MGLRINKPGMLTTLQDGGRKGYAAYGFSPSGALDHRAMAVANMLVGNEETEGVIEMTMAGISCTFTTDAVFALTGADMEAALNGEPVSRYTATAAKKGDELTMGFAGNGCRAYFAVQGGFYLKKVMGSVSTNLKCKIGGYLGRALQPNDLLFFNTTTPDVSVIGRKTEAPVYASQAEIKVVLGPQDDYFSKDGLKTFLSSEYKLTNDSDRMGVKLDGPVIGSKNGVDIISDGIAWGSIQIPSSGKPIIMLSDRQTTGGYAKIATVISAEREKLAQLKPGGTVKFIAVSLKEAVRLYKNDLKTIKRLKRKWKK